MITIFSLLLYTFMLSKITERWILQMSAGQLAPKTAALHQNQNLSDRSIDIHSLGPVIWRVCKPVIENLPHSYTFIYLALEKMDPFIYLIIRNVDLFIYCLLILYPFIAGRKTNLAVNSLFVCVEVGKVLCYSLWSFECPASVHQCFIILCLLHNSDNVWDIFMKLHTNVRHH